MCPARSSFPSSPLAATSARSPGHRLSARSRSPWRTRMRFSPTSGTTSATVASATRSSRWYGRLGGRPSAGTSACTSLKAMPVPQSARRARGVVRALRIDDGERRRQLGAGQVVVGDDDPDAGSPRRAHRVHGGDAAVAGDDQRGAGSLRRGQAGGPEVVAVAQPVRHESHDVRARRAERPGEQRRGALAVDVVVAVHEDGAAGPHGGGDGLDRLAHAGERAGVRQPGHGGAKERARVRLGGLAALHQQRRERGGNAERPREPVDHGRIGRRHHHPPEHRRREDAHQREGTLHPGLHADPAGSAGYRIAPHPSQPSMMAPLRIWLRRLRGMEVWQAPQVPPTSGTTTSFARERRRRS